MENNSPQQYQIECLKRDLANAVGRSIETYTDFNYLSLQIKEKINDTPSVSTLKRMWNYVSDNSSRSRTTLNTLARFLDFRDWTHYVEQLMRENRIESGFLDSNTIITDHLRPGDRIEMGWNPDRKIEVRLNEDGWYQVLTSQNSKLQVGMVFSTGIISKGLPLVCSEVKNGTNALGTYVAGSANGITFLRFIPVKN